MRLARTATALAVAGSLFAVGSSQAASAPACNAITDDKGDAGYNGLPSADTLDIVSADIASNATSITAVIRVVKYTPRDPQTIYGKRWLLSFEGAGLAPMYLRAGQSAASDITGQDPTLVPFDFGTTTVDAAGRTTYGSLGAAAGKIDAAAGTITITATTAALKEGALGTLKPGGVIKNLTATTFRRVGTSLLPGDDATTNKTYTAGAKSCVVPVS